MVTDTEGKTETVEAKAETEEVKTKAREAIESKVAEIQDLT